MNETAEINLQFTSFLQVVSLRCELLGGEFCAPQSTFRRQSNAWFSQLCCTWGETYSLLYYPLGLKFAYSRKTQSTNTKLFSSKFRRLERCTLSLLPFQLLSNSLIFWRPNVSQPESSAVSVLDRVMLTIKWCNMEIACQSCISPHGMAVGVTEVILKVLCWGLER